MGTETQKFSHIVLLLPRLNETSGILKKLQVREADTSEWPVRTYKGAKWKEG